MSRPRTTAPSTSARRGLIGTTFIDHAFTDLDRDDEGTTEVTVVAADGTGVAMTGPSDCPWVQVHTADQANPATSRRGLAVEPMTCPPDAFNSGTDLIVLAPGAIGDGRVDHPRDLTDVITGPKKFHRRNVDRACRRSTL